MIPTAAALFFLIVILIACLGGLAYSVLGPGRYTPLERLLYAPVYCMARVLWRVETRWVGYEEPMGRFALLDDVLASGAIIVANHRCSLDPFFVQLIAGRRVHWMVASEYFGVPVIGDILRAFEAIPTHRGGSDLGSTRKAIELARAGKLVGMFPEGRINRTPQPLLSVRHGAALVASKASVPLVPVWIDGAPQGPTVVSALAIPACVRVNVGVADYSGLAASTESTVPARMPDRRHEKEWVTRVMNQMLHMRGGPNSTIKFAGREWLNEATDE